MGVEMGWKQGEMAGGRGGGRLSLSFPELGERQSVVRINVPR